MPLPHARLVRSATRCIALIALSYLVPSGYAGAQETSSAEAHSHGHSGHAAMGSAAPAPLAEVGQSTFAALAETVAALTADPETDWSQVDVDALREHLVSMDRLVLDAAVDTDILGDGYRFTVSGDGRTRQAIHEMVPAHATVLTAQTAWEVEAERTPEGAMLIVRSDDPDARQRIGALGFFGLMATGDHHRPHHWALVNGQPMHVR